MLKLPDYVTKFMKSFQDKDFQIYLVGGIVRDILAERNVEWNLADFATNAIPEEIQKLFPDSFYENKFGTVGVKIDDKVFEVTTFRSEGKYKDSRHPEEIKWAKTIEEDLARRDFTINAMAYDGENLVDPFDGQKDLQAKLIRAVGDPDKRFQEDALRLIRAVRFAAELGFLIEDKTRDSIRKNAELITKISWERIRDEFLKILASENNAEGILFLRSTGILSFILLEVDRCFEIPQKSPKRHHVYDVGTHLVMSLKHCPSKDVITRFATLLHDMGKADTFRKDKKTELITFHNHEVVGRKQAEKIADRFRLSKKQKQKLVMLVGEHQFTVSELQTDKAVRRFIRKVGHEYIQDMLDLRTGDRIGGGAKPTSWRLDLFKKRLEEVQKEPFSIRDLKINGQDVMKVKGLKPGPEIGKILNGIFKQVEDGKLKNDKKALLEEIKKM